MRKAIELSEGDLADAIELWAEEQGTPIDRDGVFVLQDCFGDTTAFAPCLETQTKKRHKTPVKKATKRKK